MTDTRLDEVAAITRNGGPHARSAAKAGVVNLRRTSASDESAFVTGRRCVIDGGLLARGPDLRAPTAGGVSAFDAMTGPATGSAGLTSNLRPIERN